MTRADMDRVRDDFVRATRYAAEAGFDWLELHCAHGYLLSSLHLAADQPAHRRVRRLAGEPPALPARGVRARCARSGRSTLPMSVRISAHDWVEGGITPDDAVEIARAFKAAGADLIDCSSGQVSKKQQPVYGRMYQTPFADRIRNEAGIATIAVGAISEADHVNSIIAAGRADLCAVARPHLANPAWTLLEAAKIGYTDVAWPKQYRSAKMQLERNLERERADGGAGRGRVGARAGQPGARASTSTRQAVRLGAPRSAGMERRPMKQNDSVARAARATRRSSATRRARGSDDHAGSSSGCACCRARPRSRPRSAAACASASTSRWRASTTWRSSTATATG